MNDALRGRLNELSEKTLGAAFEVANELGSGFLEKVYERSLLKELQLRGVEPKAQAPMPMHYKGELVGEYYADLLVEDGLIVELKCVDNFTNDHMAQCLNYLKASALHLALLLNFQKPKVEWKRIVRGY